MDIVNRAIGFGAQRIDGVEASSQPDWAVLADLAVPEEGLLLIQGERFGERAI